MLGLIALVGSISFGVKTRNYMLFWWYLKLDDVDDYFGPHKPSLATFLHFMTMLILYVYLIPISLYVSIQIMKVDQSIFINKNGENLSCFIYFHILLSNSLSIVCV